ncbi:MAG: alcohol dehydrogenase [Acidobacteria bacterium]|nr:MAG: alcohol dehydrogenase [Acidobacteriota bacterium]
MKAVILEKFGGVDGLKPVEDFPEPKIAEDEVLVRVKTVALNHLDLWVRMGALAVKPELPHILGSDISGVVEQVGSLVKGLKEGDEVIIAPGLSCGLCYHCQSGHDNHCRDYDILGLKARGGYAQYVKVPARNVLLKPQNLSFEEACSFPLTSLTVWNALVNKAQIKPYHRVLIWGGSSGVGVVGIQLAKLFGAFVIATAGSDEKASRCKELGADMVIDHYREDVVRRVRELFKEGLDIVMDHVGSKTFQKSIECLKKGGKLVFFGTTTGSEARIDIRYIFVREIELLGVYMGPRSDLFKIAELYGRGLLKPVVDRVFRLEEAREAHEYLESSKHFGKVVLRVDP